MTTKINPELGRILSKDKSLRPEAKQILEQLSVPKDASPTSEQKESLQFCCKLLDSAVGLDDAIQQTLEKVKEKPDAEYAPSEIALCQAPIDEARLKEITLRHSIDDERIPGILEALKLRLGTLKEEHFEQFLEVCQQPQKNMDLPIVAQGVLNKASAAKASPVAPEFVPPLEPESANREGGSALTPRKDSVSTMNRSMSGLVPRTTQPVDLTGIPVDGAVAKHWEHIAEVGATTDADDLAGAPFDGIVEGSQLIGDKAEALRQHGFNLYMEKFGDAMKDPDLVKRIEDKYLGKLPERWNLKKSN
jgi:hypothetical protein